eukprot:TRINITY_DN23642_c0_g1_i1.p1 TRINITY_DN23642_c0_g1~~TRINITY_DN23642_c0_g1_i1.p1  ORF type:complete len:402 (-),score=77.39 TRINITY_DN23642_c0_g1_i1:65-1270(-)
MPSRAMGRQGGRRATAQSVTSSYGCGRGSWQEASPKLEDAKSSGSVGDCCGAVDARALPAPSLVTAEGEPAEQQLAEAEAVRTAANLITSAEVVLVIAGAGMCVDSGLHTFRAKDGTYTLKDYHDKCRHELFLKSPEEAWAFHGQVLNRFRATMPHAGFHSLLKICQSKLDHYVCTSNVDGQFQKAGFVANSVFDAHGSVHLWQCMSAKCNKGRDPWPAGTWKSGSLPKCKFCSRMARPSVSLFDDNTDKYPDSLNTLALERQFGMFETWLKRIRRRRLCIIEVGCGVSEHSLRLVPASGGGWSCMSEEWELPPVVGSLVRINPQVSAEPSNVGKTHSFVELQAGAVDALRLLEEAVLAGTARPSGGAPRRPLQAPAGRQAVRRRRRGTGAEDAKHHEGML